MNLRALPVLASVATFAICGSARAEKMYGIASGFNELLTFDSSSPSALMPVGTISGLLPGHSIRALDVRPADGGLYALSSDNGENAQLYRLDPSTAVATAVGSGFSFGGTNNRLSMDFNPVTDSLRVTVGGADNLNLRVDPNNGTVIAFDSQFSYAPGDLHQGASPFMADIAYSNNTPSASSSTLYGYDYTTDKIVRIGSVGGTPESPNSGILHTLGRPSSVTSAASIGLDISGTTGLAYLSLDLGDGASREDLFIVNLSTGSGTLLGNFERDMLDVVVASPVPEPATLAALTLGVLALSRRRRR